MNTATEPLSPVFRGMLLMLTTVMLFTCMDAIAKHLSRFYPVSMILWSRFLIHVVLFLAIVMPRRGLAGLRTTRLSQQFLRGLLLSGASFCFVTAISYMPLAEATAIAFLAPVLLTVLAALFLKEKVETGRWVAILFAFGGVLLIIRPGSDVFTWAALLPLLNAAFFATYQVLTRRLSSQDNQYAMVFYPGLVGLIVFSLTLALPAGAWVTPRDPWHLLLLGAGGLLGACSHLIMIRAFTLAPASRLAPFSYTQLIWVTVVGYIVFGNFPDHWSLAGIAILLVSGIYCANHQRLSEREARRVLIDAPPGD
jgi:drug/metabolite transporter (DMT)-like permease